MTQAMAQSGGEVLVRPATLSDVPAIAVVERACFGDPWSEASFRAMLAHDGVIAFVAARDSTIVGYGIAWLVVDEAELANLAVSPTERRSGVGARLLDAVLHEVERRGGITVHLEVRAGNEAALALYRSRDFIAGARRKDYYRAPVEDAVMMRRGP